MTSGSCSSPSRCSTRTSRSPSTFLIWNANIPEETFWYILREKGSWWSIGMLMIFGHFFLPFLLLLRIDTKMSYTVMLPLAIWAWVMHFCDLSFNIMPVLHPERLRASLVGPGLHGLHGWGAGHLVHTEFQRPSAVPAKGSLAWLNASAFTCRLAPNPKEVPIEQLPELAAPGPR
jgi:hypothetical protein